jgi:predicted small metal-binding protein
MWNCNEQNEESFDICWKCGYGVRAETPDEIESEVEIFLKEMENIIVTRAFNLIL